MGMGNVKDYIRRYYDKASEAEWERLDRHRTEYALTLRALTEHLPQPPARVLDCGGGPGRYAIELARRGYQVTLFDLSPANLELAQKKADEAGVTLAAYEEGSATDLSRFPDAAFDAVLLMGPLYHLLGEEERLQALAEAYRVLKPGGPLFAAFLSRYAGLRWAAAHEPTWIMEHPKHVASMLDTGYLPPREGKGFVAHFIHPREVAPLCRRAGFEVVTVLGVEGLVSMLEEKVNALSGEAWDTWVDLNWRVAADPALHGGVEHLLVVARRPLWRAVLRRIVPRLEEAGVRYKVVGGASLALHSVPIPVRDVDLETDAAGAYRFQELFANHVVEPVALRGNEQYRSHLGRFDFGGVEVEVVGDPHRREEGRGWIPTWTRTEAMVDVDGVPVRVSWLEEEVLAYIRRGRLGRAAQCLSHCDRERLLALLRGEVSVGGFRAKNKPKIPGQIQGFPVF